MYWVGLDWTRLDWEEIAPSAHRCGVVWCGVSLSLKLLLLLIYSCFEFKIFKMFKIFRSVAHCIVFHFLLFQNKLEILHFIIMDSTLQHLLSFFLFSLHYLSHNRNHHQCILDIIWFRFLSFLLFYCNLSSLKSTQEFMESFRFTNQMKKHRNGGVFTLNYRGVRGTYGCFRVGRWPLPVYWRLSGNVTLVTGKAILESKSGSNYPWFGPQM